MLDRIWKRCDNATAAQVFLAAFLVALLSGLFASARSNRVIGGEGHDGYLELAQNLADGHGYVFAPDEHKVFHRPPLYPLLLVPGALLPKQACRAYIIVLNAALLAASAALLFAFGRSLFNSRVGILAAAILVLNPFLLYGVKNPVSAICQMFVYFLVIVMTWRIAHRAAVSKMEILFYTLALWAAVMSHGVMLLIALLILAGLMGRAFQRQAGPTVAQVLALSTLLALMIAPWTWRNYRVTGLFIPVAGNAGLAYFAGNAHWGITLPPKRVDEYREDSEFRHAGLPLERRREWMKYYGMADPAAEKLINTRAREHLLAHPADFARKFVLNAVEYYFPIVYAIIPPRGNEFDGLSIGQRLRHAYAEWLPLSLYHLALVMCALLGFAKLRRQSAQRALAFFLFGAWIIYALPYFPFLTFVGHSLYTYGTLPCVSLLAAFFFLNRQRLSAR